MSNELGVSTCLQCVVKTLPMQEIQTGHQRLPQAREGAAPGSKNSTKRASVVDRTTRGLVCSPGADFLPHVALARATLVMYGPCTLIQNLRPRLQRLEARLEHERRLHLHLSVLADMMHGQDGFDMVKGATCLADGETAGILPTMVSEMFESIASFLPQATLEP
eukprot:3941622-Amphidinium_carterae.1